MNDISPLVRKLESTSELTERDRQALAKLPLRVTFREAHQPAVEDGDKPSQCCLLISGLMARYKVLSNGARQILAFHTAGDIPDLQSLHLSVMDHSIAAVDRCRIAFISHADMHKLLAEAPHLTALLWRETLIDAAIFRMWIAAMGRLSSESHMAHLFCEIFTRKFAIGETDGPSCHLPLTQAELADALGISTVHVNRTLQALRGKHLLEFDGGELNILDWDGLVQMSEFDPYYLQIREEKLPPRFLKSGSVGET